MGAILLVRTLAWANLCFGAAQWGESVFGWNSACTRLRLGEFVFGWSYAWAQFYFGRSFVRVQFCAYHIDYLFTAMEGGGGD